MVDGKGYQNSELSASGDVGLRREVVFYHEHDFCRARLGMIFGIYNSGKQLII